MTDTKKPMSPALAAALAKAKGELPAAPSPETVKAAEAVTPPDVGPKEPGTDSANDASPAAAVEETVAEKPKHKRAAKPKPEADPESGIREVVEAEEAKLKAAAEKVADTVKGSEDDAQPGKPTYAVLEERYSAALDRIHEQATRLRQVEAELAELRKATGGPQ